MDPIIAYFLIKNIEREKNFKQNNKNNISLVHKEKSRNIIKISCSLCGQNTYWCQCEEKNIQGKNIQGGNDNSQLLSAGLRLSTMVLSSSYE